jgi:hypothetical protein
LMAAAIGIAVTARFNPGNVVMFYPPYRFDLSLNFFLVLQAALFIVLYMLIRAFRITLKMPGRVAIYREQKREHDGNNGLREALKSLFEGRFGHAEKAALRAAELPANAALAALIGAKAAHRMRQSERCDQWLGKAATDPALKAARLMTQIELLVDAHQPEAALDAVRELSASGTRHLHALQWSLKAHQQAKNWPEVLRLVRTLDKRSAFHDPIRRSGVALRGSARSSGIQCARLAPGGAPGGGRCAARELGWPRSAGLSRGRRCRRLGGSAGTDRALRSMEQAASDRCRTGADPGYAVPETETVGQGPALSGASLVGCQRTAHDRASAFAIGTNA